MNANHQNIWFDTSMQFVVVDSLLTPRAGVQHYGSIFNDFTPLHPIYGQHGGAGYIPDQYRKAQLLGDLARKDFVTRNFYWWGHGTPTSLGDTQFVTIEAWDVASKLENHVEIVAPPAPVPTIIIPRSEHRYRFVFIDACSAGNSATWAQAFGIPGKEIDYARIANHTERAQAFLGWKELTMAPGNEQDLFDNEDTLEFFFTLWMTDQFSLEECVKACTKKGPVAEPYKRVKPIDIKFPLGAYKRPREDHVWDGMWNTKIYGYRRITRSSAVP